MGMFDNSVSEEDRQRVQDMRNPPSFESGFDGSGGGGDGFGDIFGDSSSGGDGGFNMDDIFGSSSGSSGGFGDSGFGSSGGFGSNSSGFGDSGFGSSGGFGSNSGFGNSGFGNNNGFGSSGFGDSGFGNNNGGFGGFGGNALGPSGFGNGAMGNQQQQQQQQPDTLDKMIDTSIETAKGIGDILVELFKSLKLRNTDDFGYLSRNSMLVGLIIAGAGVLAGIIGSISHIKILSFSGMGTQVILCGGLLLTSGLFGMGVTALILEKFGNIGGGGTLEDVNDVPAGEDNFTEEYEDNIGDELSDLFGEDFDSLLDSVDENSLTDNSDDDDDEFSTDVEINAGELDLESQLADIGENQYVSRETLFNTFKSMLPTCTPKFADKKEIESGSDLFLNMETTCLKALANIANCQIEELNSGLEKAYESFFSYELRVKRVNKVKKTEDLAREIEAYVRESSDQDDVIASVDIEGDYYKIIITKGVNAIVTFGDVFKQQYCCDFFLNTKNKLPMITGIDELGKVIVEDAKNFDTMLIAGKPRSGKSWYVLSVLMSLMLFNSPEDVQFCIIDPKESNLFKTIALMPHVCGLHNDEHILEILEDIIEIEAPRRKHLLSENRCDDIWALKKKGINLPVLYVVIDEYITVINNLDKEQQKEFDAKIQTLISQLPSQGIRLIFVPHRATGIVNKTNRTMLQFTAAIRADNADVIDTLGIQKWTRSLTSPGDIAVKSATMKSAAYVRGAALTTDDGDNTIFIETAAKVFYKMGVDIPDMSNMRVATNRDDEYIKNELGGTSNRVQFDVNNLDSEVNNMNFSDI